MRTVSIYLLIAFAACGPEASDGGRDTTSAPDTAAPDTLTPDTLTPDTLPSTSTSTDTQTPADTEATTDTEADTSTETLSEDTAPQDTLGPAETTDDDEPNDTLTTGTPLALAEERAGVLATKTDVDVFEILVPDVGPSGYVEAWLRSTTCDAFGMSVWVETDAMDPINGHILGSIDLPARNHVWFAAAPDLRYRFEVHAVGNFAGSCAYTIEARYTPIDDPYEGEAPAPIPLATPIKAYYTDGFRDSSNYARELGDLYTVTLVEGVVNVGVSPPYYGGQTNVCLWIGGQDKNVQNCAQPGNGVGIFTNIQFAGTYTIGVSHSSSPPAGFYYAYSSSLPAEFATPYTLTVSQ